MVELRRRYYPPPLNKDRRGTAEDIEALTIDAVRAQYQQARSRPNGAILSVAGNIEWEPLKAQVERLFGDWEPGEPLEATPAAAHARVRAHRRRTRSRRRSRSRSRACRSTDPDYYAARAAAAVLSGGMSSRLFTEVREKRGLCYSVYAFHETFKDRGHDARLRRHAGRIAPGNARRDAARNSAG